MDKLRLDFFDILGYLIPGTALLLSLWVAADSSIYTFADLYSFVCKITANTLLSGVVVAYVMGFTLHLLGSFLFAYVYLRIKRLWQKNPPKVREKRADYVAHYWAQLREHATKHLPMLDRWQALKALATNLAAFSLIAFFLCLWKGFKTQEDQWFQLSPLFLLLYFSYSNRAQKFAEYLDGDSKAVLEALHLTEQLPARLQSPE